ncbi:hypothetical protein RHGRI_021561 [Rhododendron griersonianum]|uniref:Uncharacterized protein n=1 Tax=Rhododendron griersonianum TaxID=479676 RepID=A0AAV6JP47_9ERIC|nr:hypothetical protein RHGRI_021561 [Rhododendron griersonianum]
MIEDTTGEEVHDTDMARFRVTPRNVEGRARLKRREVDLDDALVEDTPPSKIKGTRPQENHDVEGSSKVRSRFGSVARGIKGKHPRLDVQESAQKRTRSVNVARGIKAKHSRSRKHRDVNEGEIHETTYRASLNGMKTLIEELNLSEEHKNDDPVGALTASSATFFHSTAFAFIVFPFSPTMRSLTSLSTSSLFALVISMPNPHCLQRYQQFVDCFAQAGQHIIGTPSLQQYFQESNSSRNGSRTLTDGCLRTLS